MCVQVVGNRDGVSDVLRDSERQTGEEDLRLHDVPAGGRTRSVNNKKQNQLRRLILQTKNVYLGEMLYLYYI